MDKFCLLGAYVVPDQSLVLSTTQKKKAEAQANEVTMEELNEIKTQVRYWDFVLV